LDTKQTYKKEKKQNVSHIKGPEESKMLMLAKRAAAPPVKSTHFEKRTTLCPNFVEEPFGHHWAATVSSFTSFKVTLIHVLAVTKWQVQLTFFIFFLHITLFESIICTNSQSTYNDNEVKTLYNILYIIV
jgi:hypothetical protein